MKIAKTNYSVARVVTHTKNTIGKYERHNKRKNEHYGNMNVDLSRTLLNVHFDEVIFDVNTDYFETHGGYEYAKRFYEEAYRFAVRLYDENNILSAVLHADEINLAL